MKEEGAIPANRYEPADEQAGVYVHLPFCVVRCTYCDFYSLVGQDDLAKAYVRALEREIRGFPGRAGYRPRIASVYIGGGTPSHMPSGSLTRVLDAIMDAFPVDPDAEVTIEANPESASRETLGEFRGAGANRLSLGVQSFREAFLAMMGRPHGPEAAERAVEAARVAGIGNVSIDLIYGLPGQDTGMWRSDLERGLALGTDHLSAYLLETDKDTPLARSLESGQLAEPGAEAIADLYAVTEEVLPQAGYRRYEVSNWAQPGRECRHNLGYWNDRPYLGFGASSHSYYLRMRRVCRLTAAAYVAAVSKGGETREPLDDGSNAIRLSEAIITALRLAEGADFETIGARYGSDLWSRFEAELVDLTGRGWAVIEPPRVRLTPTGVLWSMDALAPFVALGEGLERVKGPSDPAR